MHPTTPLLWMMLCAATATAMRTAMRTISHVNTSLSSIAPFLHPRVWHFCPSDPSFWRERGRTVLALNGLKLHSLLSSPAADLSTHGFTMLHFNAKLAQLVDHTRELLDIVLETDQQEIVGEFPGMTFAPRFSPDGSKIVMSYSDPDVGNSEIYVLDLQTRISKRITNNSSIDVSGSFSPDGKNIVFNSELCDGL